MFCPTCGKPIPNASTFCLHCGGNISAPNGFHAAHLNQSEQTKTQVKSSINVPLLVLLLIGGGIIAGTILVNRNKRAQTSQPTIIDSVVTQTVATTHPVVENTFVVEPLSYVYYAFNVPQRAQIKGSFQARGGKNDIEVVMFDEAGFTNFKNGNLAQRIYYNSRGYVTTATIDVFVPPGNYYIVFNNKDALITRKGVQASISSLY